MEKEQTITIPVEDFQELMEIKKEREFNEDEMYREQTEKEHESAVKSLTEKMFNLCSSNSEARDLVNSIREQDPRLVVEVFENSSLLEVDGDILDFVEGQEYHDPIIDETYTLSEWAEFFHNPEDWNTIEVLHERCKELYHQKQELLDKLQTLIKES